MSKFESYEQFILNNLQRRYDTFCIYYNTITKKLHELLTKNNVEHYMIDDNNKVKQCEREGCKKIYLMLSDVRALTLSIFKSIKYIQKCNADVVVLCTNIQYIDDFIRKKLLMNMLYTLLQMNNTRYTSLEIVKDESSLNQIIIIK